MKTCNVLHLTHTDIVRDNRVIKEINAISKNKNIKCFGIGISEINRDKKAANKNTKN